MEILIQIIVLTIFIVACAWWNYREGMMQGINNTLDTLHKAGIIDMNNIEGSTAEGLFISRSNAGQFGVQNEGVLVGTNL